MGGLDCDITKIIPPTYLPPSPPYLPTPGSIQTCLFHQKTVGICFCVLDMCDFLTGHLAGERVYPGDKGKYYLPITEKTKSLNFQIITCTARGMENC